MSVGSYDESCRLLNNVTWRAVATFKHEPGLHAMAAPLVYREVPFREAEAAAGEGGREEGGKENGAQGGNSAVAGGSVGGNGKSSSGGGGGGGGALTCYAAVSLASLSSSRAFKRQCVAVDAAGPCPPIGVGTVQVGVWLKRRVFERVR